MAGAECRIKDPISEERRHPLISNGKTEDGAGITDFASSIATQSRQSNFQHVGGAGIINDNNVNGSASSITLPAPQSDGNRNSRIHNNENKDLDSSILPAVVRPRRRRNCYHACCTHIVDPRRTSHRVVLLLLVSAYNGGPLFFDSIFGAYEAQIMDALNIDATEYGTILGFGSLAGMICAPAASFIARYGLAVSSVVCGLIVLGGSMSIFLGLLARVSSAVLVGRMFFWGGRSIAGVLQVHMVFTVFDPTNRALANSIPITMSRVAGSLGYALSGPLLIFFANDWLRSLGVALGFVYASCACFFLFAFLYRGTRRAREMWSLILQAEETTNDVRTRNNNRRSTDDHGTSKRTFLTDFTNLTWACWSQQVLIGCLCIAIFTFQYHGTKQIEQLYNISEEDAGFAVAVSQLMAVSTPFVGSFMKDGRALLSGCLGGIVVISVGHVVLFVSAFLQRETLEKMPWLGFAATVLIGMGHAVANLSVWSLVPVAVGSATSHRSRAVISSPELDSKKLEVIQLGMCYVTESILLFVGNYAVGFIINFEDGGYIGSEAVYLICLLIGFFCTLHMRAFHEANLERERQQLEKLLLTEVPDDDSATTSDNQDCCETTNDVIDPDSCCDQLLDDEGAGGQEHDSGDAGGQEQGDAKVGIGTGRD